MCCDDDAGCRKSCIVLMCPTLVPVFFSLNFVARNVATFKILFKKAIHILFPSRMYLLIFIYRLILT